MQRNIVNFNTIQMFQAAPKQIEQIIKELLVVNKPYSDDLKRLLVINTPDCLDKSIESYNEIIQKANLKWLMDNQYVNIVPKLKLGEHEEVKSYLILTFDDMVPNPNNRFFRDFYINIDVICHFDLWNLGDYKLRPLQMAGIISGLLDKRRITGIGEFSFARCDELLFNEQLAGYHLMFHAVYFSEDEDSGMLVPPNAR